MVATSKGLPANKEKGSRNGPEKKRVSRVIPAVTEGPFLLKHLEREVDVIPDSRGGQHEWKSEDSFSQYLVEEHL